MKFPKSLRIGGHTIKVTLCDLPDGIDGEFSTDRNEIRINSKLPKSQRDVSLLHEIMHALNSEFDKDLQHIILESLSQQLYQVLSDNKLKF
jgi:Zn-dependent peptidase ImmA (M78 family)